QVVDVELGAAGAVGGFGFAGALGGVFGDVARKLALGELAAVVLELCGGGRGDGAHVDLFTPAQRVAGAVRAVDGDERGRGRRLNGCLQYVAGGPGWGGVGGAVGAVEADHGVEVHEPASLVLGDLAVRQPRVVGEIAHPDPGRIGEFAA